MHRLAAAVEQVVERCEKIDILVNNAGVIRDNPLAAFDDDDVKAVLETNVTGVFNMARAVVPYMVSRRAGRIINLSSVAGEKGGRGQTNYAASKAAGDHLVRAWYETYGLPVVMSNCSNNYGPYQFPEKLIPLIILNALEGKPLPVYGSGANVRDWLYVTDHAAALVAVLRRGRLGETYNIGGGAERSNL